MAGRVRQPIDVAALERYISKSVPEIKTPIDLKQVRLATDFPATIAPILSRYRSLVSASRIPRTKSLEAMARNSLSERSLRES
jgi:hypothetical protein